MNSQVLYRQLVWVLSVLVSGCSSSNSVPNRAESYPIRIAVTVGMVADLVRDIGGDEVDVTQLMDAGVDPHLFTPSRDDSKAIMQADMTFYCGLMLEGKMSQTLQQASQRHRTVAVGEGLPPEAIAHDEGASEHLDPHVWMDVSLWAQATQVIANALGEFDPTNAERYQLRAIELRRKLEKLHVYGQEVIGCIPQRSRLLVTSHDAFRYFGRAYGIEVQAIQGISTESEAGLKRINELVNMLVDRRVAAVFVESSVPRESIEALVRGAAAKGHTVRIADSLFSDAMGSRGTYEGTYIGMMDHNLTSIARALGCPSVPENGFRDVQ
ncbi:MAG: zinc ABC transporter substrate-binding protein [Planctomycetales bacterium]|nr:zinc ABC transporter substrate-binding protein [Planctomycetales bacterium]